VWTLGVKDMNLGMSLSFLEPQIFNIGTLINFPGWVVELSEAGNENTLYTLSYEAHGAIARFLISTPSLLVVWLWQIK
jgi:hypothetical protein